MGLGIGKHDDAYVLVVYLPAPRPDLAEPVVVDGVRLKFEVTGRFRVAVTRGRARRPASLVPSPGCGGSPAESRGGNMAEAQRPKISEERFAKARFLVRALKRRHGAEIARDRNIIGMAFGRRIAHGEMTDEPAHGCLRDAEVPQTHPAAKPPAPAPNVRGRRLCRGGRRGDRADLRAVVHRARASGDGRHQHWPPQRHRRHARRRRHRQRPTAASASSATTTSWATRTLRLWATPSSNRASSTAAARRPTPSPPSSGWR